MNSKTCVEFPGFIVDNKKNLQREYKMSPSCNLSVIFILIIHTCKDGKIFSLALLDLMPETYKLGGQRTLIDASFYMCKSYGSGDLEN